VASEIVEDSVSEDAVSKEAETADEDRRTGYYLAGHDWPAISNDLSISAIYGALSLIDDDLVGAAVRSLRDDPALSSPESAPVQEPHDE
jgi:hypothetical protein